MDYYYTTYSPFPIFSTLNSADTLTIANGGGLIAPSFTIQEAIGQAGCSISISGELRAQAVTLNGSNQITIAATGSVLINNINAAISVGEDSLASFIINAGLIANTMGFGILFKSSDNVLQNSGTISGASGVWMGYDFGGFQTLNNSGTILTQGAAVVIDGGNSTIVNSGIIQNNNTNFATIKVSGERFNTFAGTNPTHQTILNDGKIISASNAIAVEHLLSASTFELVNSGLISTTGLYALLGGFGAENITNTGQMNGFVNLAEGSDILVNTGGRIAGNLSLGSGNDIFDNRGGIVTGTVNGNSGADTYYVDSRVAIEEVGGPDIDIVYAATNWRLGTDFENLTLLEADDFRGTGNTLANTMLGNSGDNRLTGFDGNDTLRGDMGDDRLFVGVGNDSAEGGDGDDLMRGDLGRDSLRGDSGDDTLNGGANTDTLTGGTGADRFVFSAYSHIGASAATTDTIADFTQGDDLIDLSPLDANTTNALPDDRFAFITGAFTNVAGQMRATTDATSTYVEMDVNGNGGADYVIRLTGVLTLTAADFIL